MTTTTLLILEALIRYGPLVGAKVQQIIANPKPPTEAEWNALFAEATISYDAGRMAARAALEASKNA